MLVLNLRSNFLDPIFHVVHTPNATAQDQRECTTDSSHWWHNKHIESIWTWQTLKFCIVDKVLLKALQRKRQILWGILRVHYVHIDFHSWWFLLDDDGRAEIVPLWVVREFQKISTTNWKISRFRSSPHKLIWSIVPRIWERGIC